MSDGLTAVSRDEQRAEAFTQYLSALLSFLQTPRDVSRKQILVEAAASCDSINSGYWTGNTNLVSQLDAKVARLLAGDADSWDNMYHQVKDDLHLFPIYTELRGQLQPGFNAPIETRHRELANELSTLAYIVETHQFSITRLVNAAAQIFANQERRITQECQTQQTASKPETVHSITAWADRTFGPATMKRQLARTQQEFQELESAIAQGAPAETIATEVADVIICLSRMLGNLGYPDRVREKMKINRNRQWNIDGTGCAQHVKNDH